MAAIPLSWNDPMFSGVTSSGSVTLQNGGTLSSRSITDTGNVASVVGNGSFTLDGVRINSAEGVRIGGSGDIVINNSYIETTGRPGDHADGIQAYSPGGTGNVKITNTTIVSHNNDATAGMFIADDYNGTFTFDNVVFQGGPFGLRINADDKDISVSLKDVYFVGPFMYDPILLQKVNAGFHITQWENVRSATIVNGELVPGALIPPPFPVEGGAAAPAPAPAPALDAPTIASFSDDSGVAGDGITHDNAITLTGNAAANSTVKVFDGTKALGTVLAASNGTWSFTSAALADGVHKFTATATSSGVTSAASTARSVTVDTVAPTAPTITMSTSAATLASTHVAQLTGTAEASSTVTVFDGATQIGTATANNSGAWTFKTSTLASGGHNFTATAMDVAGNTGAASKALAVTIVPDAQGVPSAPGSPAAPPTTTLGNVIESAGATSLVESGDKYYLNSSSGSGPSLKIHGADFVNGTDGTWAPIAGEKTATGYQVVWKEASSGLYTAWNTDNNGNYVSHVSTLTGSTSGGAVSGTDSGLKLLETSFHQDLNGDGQIGASSAGTPTSPTPTLGNVIESAGATSLVESGDKYYLNSSSGSGPSLKIHGADFVNGTDGTWAPVAAEKTTTGYQVVWKEASSGLYTAWNTDNNGNYVSHVSTLTGSTSGGAVSGTDSGFKLLETSFHQDLNGDGQIGASSATALTQINSTDQVVATSGDTIVGTDRSDTLTSTTGNDIMVGKGGADTFVFASNFGRDVITDFTASGPSHDTVQFSKSVFDNFADVLAHATQAGRDVVIAADHGDSLTLKNTKLAALDKSDFHFA